MEQDEQALRAYYGDMLPELYRIRDTLLRWAETAQRQSAEGGHSPIEHCKARIKTPESARAKLRRAGLPEDGAAALKALHDVVGVRLVCTFPDSVYQVAAALRAEYPSAEVRDYIRSPKPNGYRSYHMLLRFPAHGRGPAVTAEVQLRTIAMDCWASLEHQLKYKRHIRNQELIVGELRRCADELASADLRMQTIHELIERSGAPDDGEEKP